MSASLRLGRDRLRGGHRRLAALRVLGLADVHAPRPVLERERWIDVAAVLAGARVLVLVEFPRCLVAHRDRLEAQRRPGEAGAALGRRRIDFKHEEPAIALVADEAHLLALRLADLLALGDNDG